MATQHTTHVRVVSVCLDGNVTARTISRDLPHAPKRRRRCDAVARPSVRAPHGCGRDAGPPPRRLHAHALSDPALGPAARPLWCRWFSAEIRPRTWRPARRGARTCAEPACVPRCAVAGDRCAARPSRPRSSCSCKPMRRAQPHTFATASLARPNLSLTAISSLSPVPTSAAARARR